MKMTYSRFDASISAKDSRPKADRIGGWGGMFLRRTPWEIPQEAFSAERKCRGEVRAGIF